MHARLVNRRPTVPGDTTAIPPTPPPPASADILRVLRMLAKKPLLPSVVGELGAASAVALLRLRAETFEKKLPDGVNTLCGKARKGEEDADEEERDEEEDDKESALIATVRGRSSTVPPGGSHKGQRRQALWFRCSDVIAASSEFPAAVICVFPRSLRTRGRCSARCTSPSRCGSSRRRRRGPPRRSCSRRRRAPGPFRGRAQPRCSGATTTTTTPRGATRGLASGRSGPLSPGRPGPGRGSFLCCRRRRRRSGSRHSSRNGLQGRSAGARRRRRREATAGGRTRAAARRRLGGS